MRLATPITICHGRLGKPRFSHLAHSCSKILGRDCVEPEPAQAGQQVRVDGVAVALVRPRPKILDWSVQPGCCRVNKAKPSLGLDRLSTSATCKQLIPKRTGCRDPALDRPPALLARGILEAHPVDAGGTAVDVALDAHTSRLIGCCHLLAPLRRVRDDRRQLDDASTGSTPLIQIGPLEEQLAPGALLVSWNRTLGSELAQRVAVDT